MNKFCFWGIALVATLGLLGVSLAYPPGAPVSDGEAATLVGGQDCFDYASGMCLVDPCDLTGFTKVRPNPYGEYHIASEYCGPDSTVCVAHYIDLLPCVPK